jgi:MoxR-like ATPase
MDDAWLIYRRDAASPHAFVPPDPPPWRVRRRGSGAAVVPDRGETYIIDDETERLVNAAIYLRRPLLVTGNPGTGKSTLAYSIAWQLGLGRVYKWSISSRSTLRDGLYAYDAIGRLQAKQIRPGEQPPPITDFLRLGPLGSALAPRDSPRVLLIDEIDKSDIDLPNDLLDVFEEGEFDIVELARTSDPDVGKSCDVRLQGGDETTPIGRGVVACTQYPIVVLTSNGEREFPPAFLRRCLRLDLPDPTPEQLAAIVATHVTLDDRSRLLAEDLIAQFDERRKTGELSTDQLLNAVFMVMNASLADGSREKLIRALYKPISIT